ncbi:DNA repair protein rad51d [Porites harrisoni]
MHRLLSLSCGSLQPSQLKALQENGVKTVADFISCNAERLAQKISVPEMVLSSLQQTVIVQMAAFTLNGSDFYDDMMSRFCITSSGCDNLDELLDGGLYSGELTEIVGAAGAGKSQICMNIALSTAMKTKKNVLYVDTGGSMSGTRIREMLQGWNSSLGDQEVCDILSRISVIQAFDIFSVVDVLEGVKQKLNTEENDDEIQHLRMIIVDSVAAVVSPILGGQQIHGHSLMVNLSRILKSLAVEHSVAVVITNNVVTDSSKSSFSTKPALGPTWAHVPNTRLFIQRSPISQVDGTERIATVIKSSRQKLHVSCAFYIHNSGLHSQRPVSQN